MKLGVKRWVVRGVVCVVMGVVTTVGVAWGLAATKFRDAEYYLGSQEVEQGRLELEVCAGVGRVRRCSAFVPDYMMTSRISALSGYGGRRVDSLSEMHHSAEQWFHQLDHRPRLEFSQEATGWPRLALWCGYDEEPKTLMPLVRGGFALSKERIGLLPQGRALPYRPIWLGLLLDSILYACCWGAIWFVCLLPSRARRLWRLRRGLCGSCGYDVAGIAGVCPECGVEVAAVRRRG